MSTQVKQPTCLITGARGYLGQRVKERFQAAGWKVVELIRHPTEAEIRAGTSRRFRLGEAIVPESLQGADALVHCAYDFSLRDWRSIERINVTGTELLFAAARAAGIRRLVFISSMSAYEGCKSMYGRAKLEIEHKLKDAGAFLVRPGLIYGDKPGGIFGNLAAQARNARWLPLMGGGWPVLYLTHQEDLSQAILDFTIGKVPGGPEPVTAAHDQGWTFLQILEELARAQKHRLRFIFVPWRPVWLAMRAAEICGVPLKFRSDSLVSLMNQDLEPSFEATRRLGLPFRPFNPGSLKF